MQLHASLRRRSVWDAIVAALCLATLSGAAAMAQFVTIESHTDNLSGQGVCGSPGHRGCSTAPTCTAPSANILRDDLYTGKIQCDLPGAALAVGKSGSLPPILPLYLNGAVTPSDTFYTSTDLHFGSNTVSDQDHVRHIRMLSQFANSQTKWPSGVGFPADEVIHAPAAIITTGDNAHDGQRAELGAYRLLYEQSWIDESTPFAVLPGFGNHDLFTDCAFNNCAQRMFDYLAGHVAGGVFSLDDASHNYSWDWNGIHYLQLNTWGGDTKLGSGNTGTTHGSGLDWLRNDLRNSVAATGRPVVIFQHYGLDPFSIETKDDIWWTADQRKAFWDIIRPYNVIGMFTGHRHATGMFDFSVQDGLPTKHIDNFVGGTGGQDPCLNNGVNPACGGRGHFFAVRIKDPYMDVASLEWKSNADGSDLSSAPYFTNLAPPSYTNDYTNKNGDTVNDTSQGPAFAGEQMGCRKIISRQMIDVSALVSGVGPRSVTHNAPLTITNTSKTTTIPGPLALQFHGTNDNLASKSFVDRCEAGTGNDLASAFMYPDDGYAGDLPPGATLVFTPRFENTFEFHEADLRLARVGRVSGSDPAVVDLNGTPGNLPPDGVITVFGPANKAFTFSATVQSATRNWISITPNSTAFDQFGIATFRYVLNRGVLAGDQANAAESELLSVSVPGEPTVTNVWVNLHLRTADTITLTASPFPHVALGETVDLKVVASYKPVIVDGGASRITGTVTLTDTTDAGTTTIGRGFLNNNSDTNPQPDNTVLLPGVTLAPGLHTLTAVYAGDSFYAPNTSQPVTVLVGPSVVNLATNPPGLVVTVDGIGYRGPTQLGLPYQSAHILAALATQSAPGSRFVFSGWGDEPLVNERQITVTQPAATYTANFDAQYQLNLNSNLPGAGIITADPPSVDGYYPAGSIITIRAQANPGYFFTSLDGGNTANPIVTVKMDGPKTVTAMFAVQATPALQWIAPADIFYGTPLGSRELNATAPVPGQFVYSPPAGTVLPPGDGQTLTATFTPFNPQYATTVVATKINVKPVVAAGLDITTTFRRDATNQIVATIHLHNIGSSAVAALQLNTAKIGATLAMLPMPPAIAAIAPGATTDLIVKFPASAGASGASAALTLAGSYTGGSFSKAARVVLP